MGRAWKPGTGLGGTRRARQEVEVDAAGRGRNGEAVIRCQMSEDRGQTTEDKFFKVLNIEQQNKEPQNDEVITSIFEIPYSTFCGSKGRELR